MTDSETGGENTTPAAGGAAPRRPAGTRKKPASTRRRGKSARKKSSVGTKGSRSRSKRAPNLQKMLEGLARRASDTGDRIADLSGEGAVVARRALRKASAASRRTIERLTREWKEMDTGKKVKFVVALLGALAAASAPLVRGRRKR